MPIASRAAMFSMLLSRCEITGRDGNTFGLDPGVAAAMRMLIQIRENRRSIYVIGNGGSASIASHVVVDLVNVVKMRAFTLHDSALLSCMANDYGYENAFSRILAQIVKPGDALIAISSSGCSKNIGNAAVQVADHGGTVITLSGFVHNNPLRSLGDINIWLDSNDYGLVEMGHQFILHYMTDWFRPDGSSGLFMNHRVKEEISS